MGYSTFPKGSVGEEELIVGTEHNTMYYYRLKNRVLQLLGHENPTIKLLYNTPLIPMKFPLNYGEPATHSEYSSDGLYSSRIDLHNEGTYSIVADAFGEMVLPTGDTISPVLRVKTEQVIGDDLYHPTNKVETYSWYTEGYRYPLFETVRNISMIDDQEIFSTSFFYPPQEHLYIDDDPENLAILEEKWRLEDEQNADENTPDVQVKTATLDDIMECRMFPNPVELVLNIEYTLKKNANVSFYIYSMEGNIVKMIKNKFQKAGTYYEYINCYSLQRRNYVLRITADDKFTNEVIIKK